MALPVVKDSVETFVSTAPMAFVAKVVAHAKLMLEKFGSLG